MTPPDVNTRARSWRRTGGMDCVELAYYQTPDLSWEVRPLLRWHDLCTAGLGALAQIRGLRSLTDLICEDAGRALPPCFAGGWHFSATRLVPGAITGSNSLNGSPISFCFGRMRAIRRLP